MINEPISKIIGSRKSILYLVVIFLGGLGVRLYYLPYEIPIVVDGVDYFLYAADIVYLGHLPSSWTPINNGWPIFLSLIFSLVKLGSSFDYMQLQRVVSIVISTATMFPIYFLCKRFVEPRYALIGSTLFLFEPRIIVNSLLGATEPLYIILGITALVLLLHNTRRLILIGFATVSLCTIVRAEGLFLFVAMICIFLIQNKVSANTIKKLIPAILVFFLILSPMMAYRLEVTGNDGIFIRTGTSLLESTSESNDEQPSKISTAFKTFVMFGGWILIPSFILFAPVGLVIYFRSHIKTHGFIIIFLIIMSLPALYAYSVGANDTRYLYIMFPVLCLLSVFAVSRYLSEIKKKNFFLIMIFTGILISSAIFYENKKDDWRMNMENEVEYVNIAKQINDVATGINFHPLESRYIRALQIPSEWPVSHNELEFKTKIIQWQTSSSLEDYIETNRNELTHLVIGSSEDMPEFLKNISEIQEVHNYLKLVYDSQSHGFKKDFKIYEIDYEKFDLYLDSKTTAN